MIFSKEKILDQWLWSGTSAPFKQLTSSNQERVTHSTVLFNQQILSIIHHAWHSSPCESPIKKIRNNLSPYSSNLQSTMRRGTRRTRRIFNMLNGGKHKRWKQICNRKESPGREGCHLGVQGTQQEGITGSTADRGEGVSQMESQLRSATLCTQLPLENWAPF